MRKTIKNGMPELWVTGYIVSDDDLQFYRAFEIDAVSPKELLEELEKAEGSCVSVKINSPGGDLIAGCAMYTALMEYAGPVVIDIVAMAASAASIIAMAGAGKENKTRISPAGLIMIHNAQAQAAGDYRDMERASDMLKAANRTAMSAYQLRTGWDDDKLKEYMDSETYFGAKEAFEAGLVDEIMFSDEGRGEIPLSDQFHSMANAIPRLKIAALKRMGCSVKTDEKIDWVQAKMRLDLERIRF